MKNFIFIISVSFLATLLRIYIDNIFLISILGSCFFGFIVASNLSKSINKILLIGFCSCFTSFSGFILVLYQLLSQGHFLLVILYSNLAIILSLIVMHLGFLIGRKFT
tara:strand:+ start:816 stop:1139 length:324 start_codon:yes stop_codon:yes gene_type:complete